WGSLQVAGLVATAHIDVDGHWDAHRFQRLSELNGGTPNVPAADMLPVGRHASLTFRAVRAVSLLLFHVLFRFKVSGRESLTRVPCTRKSMKRSTASWA